MRTAVPRPRLLAQAKRAQTPPVTAVEPQGLRPGLRPSVVATPAGPDDPADPFVVAEATALNNNPGQIYAFVRDRIKFEAYAGSVRGARGTLWAMAGNTLDKASLLTALLQAAGFTTHYMHTTLDGNSAETALIRSMFPQTPVLLGCIPSSAQLADPAYNSFAAGDSNDYYWVEYGPGNIDLDPNLPNGQPGQTLQAPDSVTFTTVPQSLRQQVTIKINAEQYSQAGGLFGFGPTTTTVLSQTFDTSALVGNIISAGNIVQATSAGGLDLSAVTFTYTPYLLIGSGGPDVSQDAIVTGTEYQELYTNYPLGNSILTGLFVEVDADDDWYYHNQPYTHTMFDRLGPAARQGNAPVQVTLPPTPAPAVTDFDIAALNILPTRLALSTFQAQQIRVNNAYQNYAAIEPAAAALPTTGTLTAAQQALAQQAATLAKYLAITENELIAMGYVGAEDQFTPQLETGYYTHVYSSAPRITIVNSSMDSSGNQVLSLDVLKNDMRAIAGLGQNTNAPYYEEVARGMVESTIEASVLSQASGQAAVDIGSVMAALGDPHQLLALGPPTGSTPAPSNLLSSTTLSADAQTLILNAIQNGGNVLTPNQMVTVDGVSTVGWWETDQFGHTVSHFPNGNHQAIGEYGAANDFAIAFNKPIAKLIGQVEGTAIVNLSFAAGVLQGVATASSFTGILKAGKTNAAGASGGNGASLLSDYFKNLNMVLKQLGLPEANELGTSLIDEFGEGLKQGIEGMQTLLVSLLGTDPEVPNYLTTPLSNLPAGVTPGATPGVTVKITTDSLYTLPYNGNELPVYDIIVTNTGPATDTFRLSGSDQAGKFNVSPSYQSLTLLSGQSGEVNLCALPPDSAGVGVAAVGSTSTFQLTATGETGGATQTGSSAYLVPAIPSVSLTVDPQVLTVSPGQTVNATITLGSLGNASPGPVTLAAAADPGITINGLTSPAAVPLNGVTTQAVTFTAGANTANNTYHVAITASYAALGGTQTITFSLAVNVTSLGTCSLSTALTANQAGMTTLGSILGSLAIDMNAAAAAPTNSAYVSRVEGDSQVVNNSLNVPYLQAFTASITAAGSAVASATPATLLSALDNLDAAICSVGAAISQASTYNTEISLSPSSMVTGPNLAATFTIQMQNSTNVMHVYSLSVMGVPPGVTSQFSAQSVTLAPNGSNSGVPAYYNNSTTLTLTPGASFTAPFTFSVVATPVGAPEFAISAPGTLLVRPQSVSIDNVTASPAYGPAGTKFAVQARVFAEVNQDTQAVLQVNVLNSAGQSVGCCYTSSTFTLNTTSNLQTVDLGTIDSTGFANGAYTLAITADFNGQPIQGATATGSILVGALLSGTLTANASSTPPGTVPPGSSTVQVALNITRDSTMNPVSALVGSVALSGIPRSMVLYQNGTQQLAYACADSYVNIVDVTHPASPAVLSTFAHNILTTEDGSPVAGYSSVSCAIYNSDLIVSYSRYDKNATSNPIPTHFATYSLANPLGPVQVGTVTDIERSDSAGLYVAGSTALLFQGGLTYLGATGEILSQYGDIWSLDLTSAPSTGNVSFLNDVFSCGGGNPCNNTTKVPAASEADGTCVSNGTTAIPNDPVLGGPYRIFRGTAVNSTTSYFGSSNAYDGFSKLPTCPVISGQLLVVNTSTPASPTITASVPVPQMAFLTGTAVDLPNKIAVAVGDSTGIAGATTGFVGTLVISSFNISNPTSPVLLNSVTTQLADQAGSFIVSLGQSRFAVGNTTNNGTPELVLVDASTPSALRYVPYDATFVANPAIAQSGYFFALSSTPDSTVNALSAFQLGEIAGPQLSVKLQLPPTNCQNTSFSLAPSSCTTGTASDTYVFNQPPPTADTITFNVNVLNVNPGDVPVVVLGGEMDYTLPSLGSGQFVLGPLTALCQQILSISPEAMPSVPYVSNAGDSAAYVVTVTNPTATPQTFVPFTLGIPASWGVQLPASVTVGPGGSQGFNLVLTTPLNAALNGRALLCNFYVVVNTIGGITASVGDALEVVSPPGQGGNTSTQFVALSASLSPSQITVGQNGSAAFQVQITNTGNQAAQITLLGGSPTFSNSGFSGWQLSFTPYQPNLLPGLSNTVTATGTVALPSNNSTPPGSYPIIVQVQYYSQVISLNLTVNVVANGVTATMNLSSGTPATNFVLNLTNTGSVRDSFNLSVVGPLGEAASIEASSGPMASLASLQIPITIGPTNYLALGSYPLEIKAVSQGNPLVQTVASTTVQLSRSKSVSAAFSPASASVPAIPGSVSLLFRAINTGNVLDSYTAAITNTTSNVTATLNGGQSIPAFAIPALGNSQFPLNATLSSGTSGTATVTVTSTSNSAVTAQSTVTIGKGTPNSCDVNQDQVVNVQDVQIMIDEALGTDSPANDLNGDGVVDVVDVQIDIDAALQLGCSTGTRTQSAVSPRSHLQTAAKSAVAAANLPIAAPWYSVTDLGTLGGSSATAYGINNLGQVVGSSDTAQTVSHAFLWESGHMTDLGLLDGASSRDSAAYGINDASQIAGVYSYPDRDSASFFYASGVAKTLSQVPHGRVSAINNAGEIVGDLSRDTRSSQAFLWKAETAIDLGTLGGAGSQARAINDSGQVAGFAYVEGDSAIHAFLYSGAGLADLGTLGGRNSMAFGINRAGQIVGASQTAAGGPRHAFLYSGGAMTDLGTLGGAESQADGINGSGLVVGWSRTASGQQHAFLWSSGHMIDLNSFAAPGPGVWLEEATAVNDVGQIVANANNGHAYLVVLPVQLQ